MQEQTAVVHIENHFRKSHGKHLSILIKQFGLENLDLLENALMESYLKALKTWPYSGIPNNPNGWIHTVSKRHYIDVLRRRNKQVHTELKNDTFLQPEPQWDNIHEIQDDELRLLFVICHPQLKPRDQLAFMLKSLSGFGIKEIAKALLSEPEQIKKSLFRARQKIKEEKIKFDWPGNRALDSRRKMVHKALYLLFNEGFYPSTSTLAMRKEMCLEAMRLCRVLCDHNLGDSDSYALMAIMCYHISRFESRSDEDNRLILLADQDRKNWDTYFIGLGHHFMEKSIQGSQRNSVFQIEAAICGKHSMADSISATDWTSLSRLYERLLQLKNTDWVRLNYIVALMMDGQLKRARSLFENIDEKKSQSFAAHYYHVGAELYKRSKNEYLARMWMAKAKCSLEKS